MSPPTEVFDAAWTLYRADPLVCLLGLNPTERAGVMTLVASQLGEDRATVLGRQEAQVMRILDTLGVDHASLSIEVGRAVLERCDALYQAAANATPSDASTLSARFPEFSGDIIHDAIHRAMFANR